MSAIYQQAVLFAILNLRVLHHRQVDMLESRLKQAAGVEGSSEL